MEWMESNQKVHQFRVGIDEMCVLANSAHGNFAVKIDTLGLSAAKKRLKSSSLTSVKLLGNPSLIGMMTDFFEDIQIHIEKSRATTCPVEAFFRPEDGEFRMRLDGESPKKVKVLVVDDSISIRKMLKRILEEDHDIEVAAQTGSPSEAFELIREVQPDVITLDIRMPEMNGVEMLKKYHPLYPIPTIMITSIRKEEGPLVMDALDSGAVDYFEKPNVSQIEELGRELRNRVRVLAAVESKKQLTRISPKPQNIGESDYELIAIGASTGGPDAIRYVLASLPKNLPPVVIVQHMPELFTKTFADRLNEVCALEVKEVENNERLKRGTVYIAQGGRQLSLSRYRDGTLWTDTTNLKKFNRHAPSVDILFNSIADFKKVPRTLAILMTGMGYDGAEGLLRLKQVGQSTAIQSEESSVVWGMPRVAHNMKAFDFIWDLENFPRNICAQIQVENLKSS